MRAYFDALLRYFELSGRSSRARYWLFELVYLALTAIAIAADYYTMHRLPDRQHPGFFTTFAMIFHIVPQFTVSIRRLHDIGKSGWWMWLGLVPFGGFVVLFWTCRAGDVGDNAYGSPGDDDLPEGESAPYTLPTGRAVRIGNAAPRLSASFDPQTISTQRFI